MGMSVAASFGEKTRMLSFTHITFAFETMRTLHTTRALARLEKSTFTRVKRRF